MPTPVPFPTATILGYPRIGRQRELKHALESLWSGRLDEAGFEHATTRLRAATLTRLCELGLNQPAAIPLDFSHYDQVLDITLALGAIPERFAALVPATDRLGLELEFALARGTTEAPPLEMTKWFDTNYHYLVPEIGPDTPIAYRGSARVAHLREAAGLGVVGRPVLVGPVSYLLLAKAAAGAPAGFTPLDRLPEVVEAYRLLLADLAAAGAPWVQLDEPALVSDLWQVGGDRIETAVQTAYTALSAAAVTSGDLAPGSRPALLVAAPSGDLGRHLDALLATGVEAVGLDLVRGRVPAVVDHDGVARDFSDRTLVAGVVDGHNVWRTDLDAATARVTELTGLGAGATTVATATSLLHVPHTVADEAGPTATLPARVASWLAFADEKVGEVLAVAEGESGSAASRAVYERTRAALADRAVAPGVHRADVREQVAGVSPSFLHRESYPERDLAQRAALDLPPLPTTTIGSFPQTPELRRVRAALRRGELTPAAYQDAIRREVAAVVALQEQLGLDVLVHGEAERNDMVQYFAEHLDGFSVTSNGWVQSYGSRCTRPSILWGDVARPTPITLEWTRYAASLTDRPVKGMLTGPVTILAWSFVRDDQPLAQTAQQVALALRAEVADLEAAGIGIIQVDEPALRELLPLRRAAQGEYLDWSVAAFRLATSGVRAATQIHTHLCYSEFAEVFDAIAALDADVTSIEAARSGMELLPAVAAAGFERGIGPGVWDIHSPRVPTTAELAALLELALDSVGTRQLWVNPDCGLKTRGYAETEESLRNLVAAARQVRQRAAA